jgi:hypothetical protein
MRVLILLFVTVVATLKVTEVAPAGTVTLGETLARVGLLLLSITINPPVGAARLSVTVPTELEPPTTAVGVKVRDESAAGAAGAAGFTVSVADLVTPE